PKHPLASTASIAGYATLDALATVGYATGIAGLTDAALTSASEWVLPSSAIDAGISEGFVAATEELNPFRAVNREGLPRIFDRRSYREGDLLISRLLNSGRIS